MQASLGLTNISNPVCALAPNFKGIVGARVAICRSDRTPLFFPIVARHNARRSKGEILAPETHLKALLYHVVLLPIRLLACALVATGPPLHCAGIVVASVLVGTASFAIYYATVDYMIAAYGSYAASATGGNGFMRDFMAGMCAVCTGPIYKKLGVQNSYLVLFAALLFLHFDLHLLLQEGCYYRAEQVCQQACEREGAI